MFTFLVYASLTVNGVVLDCSQWAQNGDGSWSAASANLYAGRRIIEGRRFDSLKFGGFARSRMCRGEGCGSTASAV